MKTIKLFSGFLLSVASLLGSVQAQASIVKIDVTSTINSVRLTNPQSGPIDPDSWNIYEIFGVGSTVNMGFSYDSSAPATEIILPQVVVKKYNNSVNSFYVKSGEFNIADTKGHISIANGNPDVGWTDEIHLDSRGSQFNFNGEEYTVITATIAFFDRSAMLLNNLSLPVDQVGYNAFLNNPYGYSLLAMLVVKTPDVYVPNYNWMSGEYYEAYGYLSSMKVSAVQVPESSGLILLLIGIAGLYVKRTLRK